jgi:hypothetical protein
VQLKLGTRQRKYSLYTLGRNRAKITGCATQSEVEVKQMVQIKVPRDESQVSVGGLLALGYGLRKKSKEKGREKVKRKLRGRKVD